MKEMMNKPEEDEVSYIFGKKVEGKKAIVAGVILGILCGLLVVGLLAAVLLTVF